MENKKSLLLLIDGNALVHRAFHALPPLTVPRTGETVGAVYGFSMMLVKAINELKPTHSAIAFDRKAPTFRHQLYDQYKAHRPPMPEELAGQLGRVREVVDAFSIPVFELDGYEADDILGTLSLQAARQGVPVVILTGDADLMQLVSSGVKIFYPRPGGTFSDAVLYDEEAVKNRYGVTPSQVADLKALKGDSSDNIPGVPGVGDKTALKLLQQFGNVETMLSRLDEVEPLKLREKLKSSVDVVRSSYTLATIVKDVAVVLDFDRCCRMDRYNRNQVVELFRDLGFNTLVPKLPETATENGPQSALKSEVTVKAARYETLNTPEALERVLSRLDAAEELSVSVEGSTSSPMSSVMVGIALSPAEGEAYYLPAAGPQANSTACLSLDYLIIKIKPLLEKRRLALNLYNSKYARILLAENGIEPGSPVFDPVLAAYLLGDKSLGLKEIVFSRTGREMIPSSDLVGSGSRQIPLFQVDLAQVSTFACANADMTGVITPLLKKELDQVGLRKLFDQVEMPLVPVLAYIESCGILLDKGLLKIMSMRLGEQLSGIEKKVFEAAGGEFNLNSPAQLGAVLFEKMNLPGKKVRGKYSTDASVLESLRGYDVVRDIMEYRQLMKLKSTYVDALPGLVNERTGRLHTSFNQTRTTTGRLSSSDPNLQNIPVRDETGREIRQAFIAPPGSVLIAGDYSQIDLRALAHLSQDENLLEAFRQDRDIHASTAAQLFGVDISEVKADMRRLAKTVNFGVIYGMSEFGLEQATDLSRAEAGKFIAAYFKKYPGVTRYLEETREQARRTGFVQTILGRRRYIPEINSPNRMVREASERMAINMPVQGTSSDIIKVAMIDLYRDMQKRGLKSKMLLQVHDELIFEVPQDEAVEMTSLVREKMSGAIELSVPLKVDIKSGPNWGAME
ncbi:MAG: DNA polymerase I [Dehalococcoidales bacterium]|nr:DNA polymerase I [Dehalococcoidales bacterium]